MRSLPDLAAFFLCMDLSRGYFFLNRVTKLGAQTQHRVVLRLVLPSASKQSEIMCARDKCGVSIILVRPSPAALQSPTGGLERRRQSLYFGLQLVQLMVGLLQ